MSEKKPKKAPEKIASEEAQKRASAGRPPLYEDPEVFEAKVEEYFALCAAKRDPFERLPMVIPLAHHLGMTCQGLIEYGRKPAFSEIVVHAKERCAQAMAVAGLKRLTDPAITRLCLAANHGWRDKTDVTSDGERISGVLAVPVPIASTTDWEAQAGEALKK